MREGSHFCHSSKGGGSGVFFLLKRKGGPTLFEERIPKFPSLPPPPPPRKNVPSLRFNLSYFALRDTFVTLWISCPPKHVMWQRVTRGTGEFKVRNLIQGTGWKIYLRWLSELALFMFATPRWWVSIRTKQLSAVAILLYRFLQSLLFT